MLSLVPLSYHAWCHQVLCVHAWALSSPDSFLPCTVMLQVEGTVLLWSLELDNHMENNGYVCEP